MPAHLRTINRPLCVTCRTPATKELRSTYNEIIGEYCGAHAPDALAEFQREESRDRRARQGDQE